MAEFWNKPPWRLTASYPLYDLLSPQLHRIRAELLSTNGRRSRKTAALQSAKKPFEYE
jgi:hypothetical protein